MPGMEAESAASKTSSLPIVLFLLHLQDEVLPSKDVMFLFTYKLVNELNTNYLR